MLCCFDRGHDGRRRRTNRTTWPRSRAITLKPAGRGSVALTRGRAWEAILSSSALQLSRQRALQRSRREKTGEQTAASAIYPHKRLILGHFRALGWIIVPSVRRGRIFSAACWFSVRPSVFLSSKSDSDTFYLDKNQKKTLYNTIFS